MCMHKKCAKESAYLVAIAIIIMSAKKILREQSLVDNIFFSFCIASILSFLHPHFFVAPMFVAQKCRNSFVCQIVKERWGGTRPLILVPRV